MNMIDLRQTSEYARYMKSIGWTVEKINLTYAFIRKFPFLGNFIKIQHPEKLNSKHIHELIHEYKPFQIIIEPKSNLQVSDIKHMGFKQSKTYFVPSKTIQINLGKSEKQLLKDMHHKTRYNVKKTIRDKLKVISTKNINQFANFWQDCALKQRGMFIPQKKEIVEIYKAFGKNAHLLLVMKSQKILSGVMLLVTKDIGYYMYAASTYEGKQLFAPTLNAWEVIKLAKKLKCKVFDFEGIYDERFPIKTWQGFTRFKKSFGGREIEYPGSFIKFRLPI
jgi:lipid II:glycine glycyltransferase (peptidoglycan interpeptide bridge formation enzyme)